MRTFAMVAALAMTGAAFAGAQEKSIHALRLTVPVWNQTLALAASMRPCLHKPRQSSWRFG